jgi:PilZ domain-containing protein
VRDRASPAPFAQLIAAAPLRLQVPVEPAPAVACDDAPLVRVEQRQSQRASLRRRGAMQVSQSLPALNRAAAPGGILVLDVSRRGLRFLYDEQLFPGEQVRIWLTETELQGEVIRCRRLGLHCYEIGIRLADPLAPALVRRMLTETDDRDRLRTT